ncbi:MULTISPECIES: energy-coupling factor transporter transmembrane component T [Kitasatospora]|uniref:energy-coupling factor transporter transmembrane component T n=1 Tax=Kitasatospora TaxID=2063 RepID=UPI000C7046A6|nr:energy-coupling factor transporter transmembrane component T [Kitasatospora sp. GP30]MDH6138967.1 energy-coupling factor transport system permease protein [Kitasatospora sp. GP30]
MTATPNSRPLHPGAWWLWALGLAAAASRSTNPLLLLLIMASAALVVAARRTEAPWARSYAGFLRVALAVLALRLVFTLLLGSPVAGSHTILTLPQLPLPAWAQGVRIGGRVTLEGLLFTLYDALRLAAVLVCVGAANALASPARLLRLLPGALYEVGVAVVVALSFAPNLLADVQRLRAARRLRGRPDRGVRSMLSVGLPVLESALERSIALAAAMDTRGFGRTRPVSRALARATTACTVLGLLGLCAAVFGLLGSDGGGWALPALLAGLALTATGLALGSRRTVRTRYRPEGWSWPEWLVAGSGLAAAAVVTVLSVRDPAPFTPTVVPPTAPVLPLFAALAVLLALLPAIAAPRPLPLTPALDGRS